MNSQAKRMIVAVLLADLISPPAGVIATLAQDVPGIEICTRESRLDRRTGCLQSNIEFLQQVVARNALDAQQKLGAANRDIGGAQGLVGRRQPGYRVTQGIVGRRQSGYRGAQGIGCRRAGEDQRAAEAAAAR